MNHRNVPNQGVTRHRSVRVAAVAAALGTASVALIAPPVAAIDPPDATIFVSEIHYDNAGADVGEAIEIFGPAGSSLDGWSVVLYNGSNGTEYASLALPISIPDLGDGVGVVTVDGPSNGIQNGSPDGIALIDNSGAVVQFISYEGAFMAVGGLADGAESTDIGVEEPSNTAIGDSLQLVGAGTTRADFTWAGPQPNTFGAVNGSGGGGGGGGGPVDGVAVTEFHYDNAGADVGEAIEISGPADTDLTDWVIEAYNGNDSAVYDSVTLSGAIDDEGNGFGALSFDFTGLQNGAPDGFALSAPDGAVVDFLSYEGTIVAVGGAADTLTSTDVGVSETGTTSIGESLQLIDGVWSGPAASTFGTLNSGGVVEPPVGSCEDAPAVTFISEIQSAGAASPCVGEDVVVEGVVVADYEDPSTSLSGFYVQEEDADADADPLTSEGVFVFNPGSDSVSLGDLVRVSGTVSEFQDQTQIGFATITVLAAGDGSSTPGVTPTVVTLPLASADALEAVEGMLVTFPQELTATEYFQLGRFGQVVVSSGGRLDNPTAVAEPGADAQAVQAANDLNRLIIDDTSNFQNPEPIIYGGNGQPLTAENPLRGGDITTGATGVMTYTWAGNRASGNAYRLRPATVPIEFMTANPRPESRPEVGGTLTAASFNVLNYFLTIDETIDGDRDLCGPIGSKNDCRGADSDVELERQRTKLLAALVSIDADVIGLIELENTELADGTVVEPLADIVAGLNEIDGAGTWDFVNTGVIGTDVIKVGLIYRTAQVSTIGDFAILDSSVDPRFVDTLNRPALASTFVEDGTGEVMTVVVNHFKSKGCGAAAGADADQGDGQGCWNAARSLAAQAEVDWIASNPTGIADDDVLVIGDLNSYAKEDPISVFADAGFVDLAPVFDDNPYSYVFDGQWGYLDYALASPSLVPQVTGAAEYHINADEVPVLDYNTDFQSDTQIDDLYAPDRFRTSDHDPVLVGLGLDAAPGGRTYVFPPVLWPTNGRLRNVYAFGFTDRYRLAATSIVSVTSSEADSGLAANDQPNDIEFVDDRRVKVRAEAFDPVGRRYSVSVAATADGQVRVDTKTVYVFARRGRHSPN